MPYVQTFKKGFSVPLLLPISLTVLLLGLGGCGSEIDAPGETLRILAETLEPAFLNEPYSATLRAVGGLSPYSYDLREGALPPGLELQGNTLRGTPTATGTYTFTVSVSDANLSTNFESYSLQVVEAPPASLTLNAPGTEVARPFLLRGEVRDARDLQALRTLVTWDPTLFELVPESVRATRNDVALLYNAEEGSLNLDVAVLGEGLRGNHRLFEFALRPSERTLVTLDTQTEFLSSDFRHAFTSDLEGASFGADEVEDVTGGDATGGSGTGGFGEDGTGGTEPGTGGAGNGN